MNFWAWAWTWVVWVVAYRSFDMVEWLRAGTQGSPLMWWHMLGVPTMYAVVFGVLPVLLLRSGVRLWKNR